MWYDKTDMLGKFSQKNKQKKASDTERLMVGLDIGTEYVKALISEKPFFFAKSFK